MNAHHKIVFRHDLIVVDNFYPQPDRIRNFALSCDFDKPLISSTPALISSERDPNWNDALARIASLVNVEPNWREIDEIHSFWGQSACGEFQLSLDHLSRVGQVHSHRNGEWVGIVYLSRPAECQGRTGTFILEHKNLSLSHASQINKNNYSILKENANDQTHWKIVFAPAMKFNRLFLFDSRLFHAESPGFGKKASDGRLVQIFNFSSPVQHAIS